MIFRLAISLFLLVSSPHGQGKIGVTKVAGGFERPVWAGMPAGSQGKLWVMEQAGRVWIVDLGFSPIVRGAVGLLDQRVKRAMNTG